MRNDFCPDDFAFAAMIFLSLFYSRSFSLSGLLLFTGFVETF